MKCILGSLLVGQKLCCGFLGEIYKVDVKEPPQGVTPPSQSLKKQQRRQMRRFIAKNSAGLRVRTNPSLQSEQIGVVSPEGIISFIDEVRTTALD